MLSSVKKIAAGKAPAGRPLSQVFWSWLGAAISIALVGFIADISGEPLLMAPLGATAVLAFAVPESPLAQPRNIIGGHMLTALVGLIFLSLFGANWWIAGLAVATSIAGM